MSLKVLTAISLFAIVLFSCDKEQDLSSIDLGYNYFPLSTGSFVIYRVDSTFYGISEENYDYQIKEEVGDQFVDGAGQPAFELHRYYRESNSQPWEQIDVWIVKRTTTTAERVEENQRFVKMEFPVKEGETWNGNVFNAIGAQEYSMSALGQFADVGILQFPKTVTINQMNNVNLVDEEVFYEIYAENVGLVLRQATDLNKQGSEISGYSVRYEAVAYSVQ